MKKLLWLISISCFLPAVTGMPSQASSLDTGIAEVEADKAVDGFLKGQNRSSELSTPVVDSFTNSFGTAGALDIISSSNQTTQGKRIAVRPAAGLVNFSLDRPVQPSPSNNPIAAGSLDIIAPTGITQDTKVQKVAALDEIAQASPDPTQTVPAPTQAVPAPTQEVPAPAQVVPAPTQAVPAPTQPNPVNNGAAPSSSDQSVSDLDRQLEEVKKSSARSNNFFEFYSPALTIMNPAGFGADSNTLFLLGSVQFPSRANATDGEIGIGVGLGDAWNAIGAELSYTIYSVRGQSQGFGSGAFNAKLHKRIAEDTAVAIGWNRFADVKFAGGAGLDFDYPKNSYYAVATQIIRTTESIDDVFSRIALTAGVGGGQFLPLDANLSAKANIERTGVGVFGSAAVRLARPVSAVVEWTGQDLAAGLSIVPFQGFPLLITPASRDLSGIPGQSARFVLGVSTAIKF